MKITANDIAEAGNCKDNSTIVPLQTALWEGLISHFKNQSTSRTVLLVWEFEPYDRHGLAAPEFGGYGVHYTGAEKSSIVHADELFSLRIVPGMVFRSNEYTAVVIGYVDGDDNNIRVTFSNESGVNHKMELARDWLDPYLEKEDFTLVDFVAQPATSQMVGILEAEGCDE